MYGADCKGAHWKHAKGAGQGIAKGEGLLPKEEADRLETSRLFAPTTRPIPELDGALCRFLLGYLLADTHQQIEGTDPQANRVHELPHTGGATDS